MTRAYYSTVLDHPRDTVWSLIRDFNNYPAYIDGVTESVIEDDKRGDEVGAVRRFHYHDDWIRQRLIAHSDEERCVTYDGIEPFAYPAALRSEPMSPARYQGTMHLLPIIDGRRTFIEWYVDIDTVPGQAEGWRSLFDSWIPQWTDSLRRALARRVT